MPIIYTYPSVTPAPDDLLLISDVSATSPKIKNATRKCTVGDIVSLVGPLVPGGGTVTSVKLDFDPAVGTDTGLRLWNGVAFTLTDQTITTTGSFEVGGTLFATHGGTGLSTYADGDVLYYDSAASTTELQTVTFVSAPVGNGDVLTLAGGLPTWATPTVGTMVNWVLTGDNAAPQTIVNLDVVDIRGGNIITTVAGAPADGLTINHDNVSHTQTPTSSTLAHGGTFTAINHVTVSTEGHFTASDLETYTLPTAGGVTSITTGNHIGGGIDFAAIPNPIIGTGTIDLKFAGARGDILYADSATSLALLPPSTPKYVLKTSGVGADPYWGSTYETFTSAQDSADVNLVVTETDASTDIVKLVAGTNITLVDSGANAITINSTGGGSAGTDPTDFVPILVTQGIEGTDPLVGVHTVIPNPPLTYVDRYATYSTIGSHVYIDFYLSWRLDNAEGCTGGGFSHTLGIAVGTGEGNLDVAGLDSLVGLENLKTEKFNNAGIHITGAGFTELTGDPDSDNWVSLPQGGKLNHFYNGSDSVAWLHWLRNVAGVPGGTMQTDYSPDQWEGTHWWQCPLDPEEERLIWVSGSLNPIIIPEL